MTDHELFNALARTTARLEELVEAVYGWWEVNVAKYPLNQFGYREVPEFVTTALLTASAIRQAQRAVQEYDEDDDDDSPPNVDAQHVLAQFVLAHVAAIRKAVDNSDGVLGVIDVLNACNQIEARLERATAEQFRAGQALAPDDEDY